MADFRKWFFALVVVALVASTASAQTVTCNTTAGSNILRSEGLTELLGDIFLVCNGGPNGVGASTFNVQVTFNTDYSSQFANSPDTLTDSTLVVTNTNGVGSFSVTPGRKASSNSAVFLNVSLPSLLAVGTTTTLRISNLRGNATGVATGTAVTAFVSSNNTTTGGLPLTINNPQLTVGTPTVSLTSRVRTAADDDTKAFTALACVNNNDDLFSDATKTKKTTNLLLQFREQQQFAWKTAAEEVGSLNPSATAAPTGGGSTTTGNLGLATNGTRLKAVFNNVPANLAIFVTTRETQLGSSDRGLIPSSNGTLVSAASRAVLVSTDSTGAGGTAPPYDSTVVNAGPAGSGGTTTNAHATPAVTVSGVTTTYPATFNIQAVTIVGGSGTAVWEVIADNPQKTEDLAFGVVLAYKAGQPPAGTATVNMSLAPTSTNKTVAVLGVPTAGQPVPRFSDTSAATNAFVVNPCATNLLYPYVTNQGGFDTGLVVSNTSSDPFGTAGQAGTCVINYYGSTSGGGAAPDKVTSQSIPAGGQLVWTLSSGGNLGVTAAPGFQGYVIAQCNFRFGHGFAFVSDLGARTIAMGYLPLVMDASGANRDTKTTGEQFNN